MDPSTSHQADRTTSSTGSDSNSPPSLIWIIIPLVVVLLTGALIAISYRVVTRCRRRKVEGGDPEQAATELGTTTPEVGDATPGGTLASHGARHPWGWAFDPNSSSSGRGATRTSEGLNELGEAPPPYGQDNERPKSYVTEMAEVGDGGEGPSGTVLRREPGAQGPEGQRLSEAGSEPPAYEMAMGSGEASSIREPPPAVTPRSR